MKGNNSSKNNENITVFAAMLDWGLGHTTRCIPILNEFLTRGFYLVIACTENQKKILQPEIPGASFRILKGYDIRYSTKSALFTLNIIRQLPKIFKTFYIEKQWLKEQLKESNLQRIIIFSDNRPGFRHAGAYNIYMTHQLTVKTGSLLTGILATTIHRYFIRKFNECWVPDTADHSLSGKLSEQVHTNIPKQYIGPLSRFHYIAVPKNYDIAVILSGPEPQRTILENIILDQLESLPRLKTILVRGIPKGAVDKPDIHKNIICYNYLAPVDLNLVICASGVIICRAGYSSIMDLICTRSKAVLIPTPGQGEQEYLAKLMTEKKVFMTTNQNQLSLTEIIEMSRSFPFNQIETGFDSFRKAVGELAGRMNPKTL